MFQFKQFAVDQANCAMKINTDGVLLGAMADVDEPLTILDIGTGTGVIALMLAQRFPNTTIDAVEIDILAAATAKSNFANSPFAERLTVYSQSFQSYFASNPEKKYDLIVSNPPFFLNSLESPKAKTNLAKHTDESFFQNMMPYSAKHLTAKGVCWLVLPLTITALVNGIAANHGLNVKNIVSIKSFESGEPHREIISFGFDKHPKEISKFTIYDEPKVYSGQYINLLQPFFIAF